METASEQTARDALERAIEGGLSLNQIATTAGLDWAQLQRFRAGKQLTSGAFSKLLDALGLEIRPKRRKKIRASEVDT